MGLYTSPCPKEGNTLESNRYQLITDKYEIRGIYGYEKLRWLGKIQVKA